MSSMRWVILVLVIVCGLAGAAVILGPRLQRASQLRQSVRAALDAVQAGDAARLAQYIADPEWTVVELHIARYVPPDFVSRIRETGIAGCPWLVGKTAKTKVWLRAAGPNGDEYYLANVPWTYLQGRWQAELIGGYCFGPMTSPDWSTDMLLWDTVWDRDVLQPDEIPSPSPDPEL